MRPTVFVSSVIREYSAFRDAAVQGIRAAGGVPLSMAIENMTLLAIENVTLSERAAEGAERPERGVPRKDLVGAHHRVPPCSERSAETAREAVGWMALESSAWWRIR